MVAIFRFTLPARKDWSPSEQAEFVRAAAILRGTGLPIVCETGVSDEGDPWVIFLREDTGDVIAHIAKIDGQVMAASAATGDVVCGPSFRTVMDKVVRSQPLVLPSSSLGDRIHLHPSAVIVAFIATALAFSVEDDSRLYDWKVDHDGMVALVGGTGREGSGNVLRDSLFSKAEASRLGLDVHNQNLSSSLVVAAALAAVAIAAKSMDLLMGEDSDRLLALPDSTDRTYAVAHHDSNTAPADQQAAAPDAALPQGSSGSEHVDLADIGQDGLLWQMPRIADGLAQNIKLLFDARIAQLPDLPVLATEKASLANGLLETVGLKTLPPVSEASGQDSSSSGAPAPVAVTAPKSAEAVDVAVAPAAPVIHTVAQVTLPQGPSFTFHGGSVTLSPEAIKLLFSPELAFGTSRLTFLDGPDNQPSLVSSSSTSDPSHTASQTASTTETPSGGKSGYQLIDDILSFASDSSHELGTSTSSLKSLNQALADMPYLPAADRILIIDLPELNADVFKFVDGLTMMSQKAAEKLLPSLDLHAQAEMLLSSGETLKLLGVIDLHPDNPTTTHV